MTDSPKQGPARIVVRIDELVLHGVAPGDRHAIADAVREAITRQLQQAGSVHVRQLTRKKAAQLCTRLSSQETVATVQ